MLKTVKSQICENLPEKFVQYYQSYIFMVQDKNIAQELKFFEENNHLNIKTISIATNLAHKELL